MVKRYSMQAEKYGTRAIENEAGKWVTFEDYAALEALYKHMEDSRNDWRDIAKRREQATGGG